MKNQTTLACDRHALSAEQRKHHFEVLGPKLRIRVQSIRELADGYEFEFPGDSGTFGLVSDWADGERLCCPFFEIELKIDRGVEVLWLRLRGPDGAKAFIRSELTVLFETHS